MNQQYGKASYRRALEKYPDPLAPLPPLSLYVYVPFRDIWVRKHGGKYVDCIQPRGTQLLVRKTMYNHYGNKTTKIPKPSKRCREVLLSLLQVRDVMGIILEKAINRTEFKYGLNRYLDISDMGVYACLRASCKLFKSLLDESSRFNLIIRRIQLVNYDRLRYLIHKASPFIHRSFIYHCPMQMMQAAVIREIPRDLLYLYLGFDEKLRVFYKDTLLKDLHDKQTIVRVHIDLLSLVGSFFTLTQGELDTIIDLEMVDGGLSIYTLGRAVEQYCYD